MELFKASDQWSKRPADERFANVAELRNATHAYAMTATEREVPFASLRTEANGTEVRLIGPAGNPALLTHWAFGQLANRVQAPAEYLRNLPATLAAQNLNYGLAHNVKSETAQLLFHTNGSALCRAITTDRYSRIWNFEIADRLGDLETRGWVPATPTIRKTVVNDTALFASDHDLFAFMMMPERVIAEPGSDSIGLLRGVIVENSEVGAGSLKFTRFYFRDICGNFIVWGASEVIDLSLRHIGNIRNRMSYWSVMLQKYADESGSDMAPKIETAKRTVIADTKEGVLDKLFGIRSLGLSRKVLDASYDAVRIDQDGSPNTVWGIAQGITRHSQTLAYADKRNELDRAAGRVLAFTF